MVELTQAQRLACDPQHSVWVTANAGTGKTKVLTDRVLRLLLLGNAPEKIVCLTFTKAAAAEMLSRVQTELARWTRLSEDELNSHLTQLLGHHPAPDTIRHASQLFFTVIDAEEGLRIMTLHSLCQTLLQRFSIEAGISPFFKVMDERQSKQLIEQARRLLFTISHSPLLTQHLQALSRDLNEEQMNELMSAILAKRDWFEAQFRGNASPQALKTRLYHALSLTPEQEYETALRNLLDYTEAQKTELSYTITALAAGSKTDQQRAEALTTWQHAILHDVTPNAEALDGYLSCLLTAKHEPQKRLCTKAVLSSYPNSLAFLEQEQQRALSISQLRFNYTALENTLHVAALAEALIELYRHLKEQRGLLDFDDLISDTSQLLKQANIAPWVLFKLDQGIDHLLVDEAQDTSPVQWQIIRLLADDFFSGDSARRQARSLFVVGDEKQSIYRFQGADPQAFMQMKHYFAQRVTQAQASWQPVSLSLSFRSTQAVLTLVDQLYQQEDARHGVLETGIELQHQPFRCAPGRVELWPLSHADESEQTADSLPSWRHQSAPLTSALSAREHCAEKIATTLAQWIREKRPLPARNRPLDAGDILILVRQRSGFYYRLIRALERHGLPVAGEDRLQLLEQLAIQDLLALLDFLLLPEDDFALANVLKSPFFAMEEATLFTLCYQRPGTLWQRVQESQPTIAETLRNWLNKVDFLRPYELISHILDASGGREKLVARLGTAAHDALNELLSLAQDDERLHTPSLQRFVQQLRQDEISLKREMEQAGNKIRVMTVHGSKGLQAPIVILPDTTGKPSKAPLLCFDNDIFFYPAGQAAQAMAVKSLKSKLQSQEMQEYRRLLYVALTRAADELYITGWMPANSKDIPHGCWYQHLLQAMQQCGTEVSDGHWQLQDAFNAPHEVQTEPAMTASPEGKTVHLPEWFYTQKPHEPSPPRPLNPSQSLQEAAPGESPLASQSAIQRGICIHKLLEILPNIDEADRADAAILLLKKRGIAPNEAQRWIDEVKAILNHPEFKPLFSSHSLAEVPITAMLDAERILSGQIDRLAMDEQNIWIIDYKTSRHIPNSSVDIPLAYRKQLQAYAQTMQKIYPHKTIHLGILWTHAPRLMKVENI